MCRTAAAAAGKPFSSVVGISDDPRGCYYFTRSNNVYFNTNAVGAGRSTAQLLCAAATTGPLPPRLRFGRACSPMRDCCDGMGSSGMQGGPNRLRVLPGMGQHMFWQLGIPTAPLCASLGAAARRRRTRTALGRAGYSRGTDRVLMGAHTVLTGYSNGPFVPRRVLVSLPFAVLAALRGIPCSAVRAHRYGVARLGTHGHLTALLGTTRVLTQCIGQPCWCRPLGRWAHHRHYVAAHSTTFGQHRAVHGAAACPVVHGISHRAVLQRTRRVLTAASAPLRVPNAE